MKEERKKNRKKKINGKKETNKKEKKSKDNRKTEINKDEEETKKITYSKNERGKKQ